MKLREHQGETRYRFVEIALGNIKDKLTLSDTTPAGGKTGAGAIGVDVLLDANVIDSVVWVVPTGSLCTQVEHGFMEFDIVPRKTKRALRSIKGQNGNPPFIRPSADHDVVGIITTYQAIAANNKALLKEFGERRFLLILDEAHHLYNLASDYANTAESWLKSLDPVRKAAVHTLMLSGTTERHDQRDIGFLSEAGLYYDAEDGRRYLKPHIRYRKSDALRERAIRKAEFELLDGEASWTELGSPDDADADEDEPALMTSSVVVSEAEGRLAKRAVSTALTDRIEGIPVAFGNPKFRIRRALLEAGVKDWRQEIKRTGYESGMLVVCGTQLSARQAVGELIKKHGFSRPDIALAISDEPGAHDEIERYRIPNKKQVPAKILVSVGMTREGFDAQHTTHLVLLTGISSRPWLDQIVARTIRVDRKALRAGVPYAEQRARIFALKSQVMQEYVRDYLKDQDEGLAAAKEKEERTGGGGSGPKSYVPIGAVEGVVERVATEEQVAGADDEASEPEETTQAAPIETPRQRERRLASEISQSIKMTRRVLGLRPAEVEARIKAMFGKSRTHMGDAELEQVIAYLRACAKTALPNKRRRVSRPR